MRRPPLRRVLPRAAGLLACLDDVKVNGEAVRTFTGDTIELASP